MDYDDHKIQIAVEKFISDFTSTRVMQISERNDVIASCSLEYLRQLHAEIFQDFPDAFMEMKDRALFASVPDFYLELEPGQFRDSSTKYNPRSKIRSYGADDIFTFYSCMDTDDLEQAEAFLSSLDIQSLKHAPEEKKIATVAEVYEKLDFLHPFPEGNSRTLRLFTEQLAKNIGLGFNWDYVDRTELYAARDLNLSKFGEYFEDANVKHEMARAMKILHDRDTKDLKSLIAYSLAHEKVKISDFMAMLNYKVIYTESPPEPEINVIQLLQPGREDMIYSTIKANIQKPNPEVLENLREQTQNVLDALEGNKSILPEPITGNIATMDNDAKNKLKAQCQAWLPEISKALGKAEEYAHKWQTFEVQDFEKMYDDDGYHP